MGSAIGNLESVAQLIQLAVAPIFLLTAVAATLTLFAGRLARIVDRGRSLQARTTPDNRRHLEELSLLEKRAHIIYRALTFGVFAAILVCLLMTLAFAGAMLGFNAAKPVAILFMTALFAYTGALICLLREVFLAIGNFNLAIHDVSS